MSSLWGKSRVMRAADFIRAACCSGEGRGLESVDWILYLILVLVNFTSFETAWISRSKLLPTGA